ncbi:hypothetical protein F503_02556 [Ophiostoma piceae UAMH 11346]|uniref:Uncharacterized protein n=1 Tax=Ophiostoma piceae (strain UAMH 11346) TaxID=1262450 RepID=S3CJ30_OPHP1|nr:hypothetical protein F503_02556 [Ophiostoma piceae UAMH 11346]
MRMEESDPSAPAFLPDSFGDKQPHNGLELTFRHYDILSSGSSTSTDTSLDTDSFDDSYGSGYELPVPAEKDNTVASQPGFDLDQFDGPVLDSADGIKQELSGIVDEACRDSMTAAAPMAVGLSSVPKIHKLAFDIGRLYRQASGHGLPVKRKVQDTNHEHGPRKQPATNLNVAAKLSKRCDVCKQQKKGPCGWASKGATIFTPCLRALGAKRKQNGNEKCIQASLDDIVLYTNGTPGAFKGKRDLKPILNLTEHKTAFKMEFPSLSFDERLSPNEILQLQEAFGVGEFHIVRNSRLSCAIIDKAIRYSMENQNSAAAAALRLCGMCHARENIDSVSLHLADGNKPDLYRITTAHILDPLRADLIAKLEAMLYSSNADKWVDYFLASFLLLDLIDRILWESRFMANPVHATVTAFREQLCHSGNTILAYYHHCISQYAPPLLDWFDHTLDLTGESYTDKDLFLLKGVKECIDFTDGDYNLDESGRPSPTEMCFLEKQLFFKSWSPVLP